MKAMDFRAKTLFLFLSLVLLFSETSLGTPYTFADCIDILKKNNSELAAAEQSLEAAREQKNSFYWNFLPKVSANLGYQRGETDQLMKNGYTASLMATQNVFNGFSDNAKISEYEGKVLSAQAGLQAVKAKLSYDLKSAFAGLLYAEESLKLAKSIFKRRSDNLNMVELRFAGGRENKGAVLLSRANLKQAQLDILKAEHAYEAARSSLIRVLGLNADANLTIQGAVPIQDIKNEEPDFQKLAEQAPQRQDAQGKIQSAEASLSQTTSLFLPTLDLSGSVGKMGEDFFPDKNRWAVGATFTWSLFSGGKDYFSRKSALALKMVAENTWKNSYLDLLASLRITYFAFVEATEQVKVSNAFVEAGSVRAEIGRSKYNNGLTTFDDWDKIESDLITFQKDQTLKRRDRIVAEASWEKTQGIGVVP